MPVCLLPDTVIDQIAAGEVVERPAAVVKELLENSLDAGATRLRVHLQAGGCDLIRITDNGHGMGRDDALMSLERHATSKIQSIEDLVQVRSFGFRGEAVPSIASVSRFELRTRPQGQEVGTLIQVEGGAVTEVRDVGCAEGTEINVRELFYNVPVRRSFLRTAATELGHCVEAVTRQLLLRPQVDVLVLHNRREHLRLPATSDRLQRARDVLGDSGERLLPISFEVQGIEVEGFVAPPSSHQASSKGVYLYVNGRYVRDAVVRRGVREAFQGLLPAGRHPVAVIEVRVPGSHVDVNVHPSKIEVRFLNPRAVSDAVSSGLREALRRGESRKRGPETGFDKRSQPESTLPLPGLAAHPSDDPAFVERARESMPAWHQAMVSEPSIRPELGGYPDNASPGTQPEPKAQASAAEGAVQAPEPEAEPPTEPTASLPAESSAPAPALPPQEPTLALVDPELLLAGDLACAALDGELVVLDLRAVRATLIARELQSGGEPERLLMPVVCTLGRAVAAKLVAWQEPLESIGISITSFGPGEVAVKRRPASLADLPWAESLPALAELLPAKPGALPERAVEHLAASPRQPVVDLDEARAWLRRGASLPLVAPYAVRFPARALRGLIP